MLFVVVDRISGFCSLSIDYHQQAMTSHLFQEQPPEIFYIKTVLQNFAIFTGKHLYCSLIFNKVAVKKRLQQRCFPVNIAKCLKTPILKSICQRLLRGCFFVWNHSHHSPFSPVTLTVKTENTITNWLYLKAYRQISKKWCFKKYCSCDKVCQFSAL